MQKKPDPIDVEMQNRLDAGRDMTGALFWAETAWDKEMNKAYHALLAHLPPHQKPLLVASQRQWVRFRDAEFAFMSDLLQYKHDVPAGTAAPSKLAYGNDRVEFVKARTLALRAYKPNPYQD